MTATLATYADIDDCFKRDTDIVTLPCRDDVLSILWEAYCALTLREQTRWLSEQPPDVQEWIAAAKEVNRAEIVNGVIATAQEMRTGHRGKKHLSGVA